MRKPFYRKKRGEWYVWHAGRQHRLGPDKEEAFARWHELVTYQPDDVEPDAPVVVLLDKFLDWVQRRRAARTYLWYQMHLESFAQHVGAKLRIADLKPKHVTAWVDRVHPDSSPSTVHGAIRAVQRAFNWATREGHVSRNPVAAVEKPTPNRREVVLSEEEFEEILAKATDQAEKDYLTVQWETGMRPQEIRAIEAKHFEEQHERIVFPPSEAKGRRLPRVIYLNEKALEVVRRLARKHPTGPIFRNGRGKPWTPNSIRCRFRKYKRKGLCSTVIRHSWATNALARGVDPITVSILLGHTDITTLSRTYAHLAKKPDFLRDAVRKATGEDS